MRVLIVTDAFPPRCGGSGWSTFHLAKALLRNGHEVRVVKPQAGSSGVRHRRYDEIEVTDFGYFFRDVPYVRNVLREDVMARRLREFLADELRARAPDVVHAQHVLSAPPAIAAGRQVGVPVVVTVRDYWPKCYFTTLHVDGESCPDCSFGKMLRCIREKSPAGYWAAIPMMPYMRRSVRRKQARLREAAAVIAVSRYVADRVVRPIVGDATTHVIPNSIDGAEVSAEAASPPATPLPDRFLLFVGKLSLLKGAAFALDVVNRLRKPIPLVIVGDGVERQRIERRIRESALDVRLVRWVDNVEVWRIMRRATLVLVPSLWQEPLSRTVTEAMAVGAPVVATDRGGIHDQIEHEVSGLICPADPARFAEGVEALLADESSRARLARAARLRIETAFDHAVVVPRLEALYRRVAGLDHQPRVG